MCLICGRQGDKSANSVIIDCFTNLSSFDFVHPTSDFRSRQHKWVFLQELNVLLQALFYLWEIQKVNLINHFQRRIRGVGVFDDLPKLISGKREHAASRVMEYGNFTSTEEALGNDNTAEGVPSKELLVVSDMLQRRYAGDIRGTTGISNDVCITFFDAQFSVHA